jgi:hypothetical protein
VWACSVYSLFPLFAKTLKGKSEDDGLINGACHAAIREETALLKSFISETKVLVSAHKKILLT